MKQTGVLGLLALMIVLLLAACGEGHEQMLQQLEELERQNRAYETFTSDSLAERLVQYFDRHGDANERMRSHYILGCVYRDLGEAPAAINAYHDAADCADTTATDCDFHTLNRVYSQMADVFYQQNLMEDYIKACNKAINYAWGDRDTLQVFNVEAHIITAYNRLKQYDKVIAAFEDVYEKLLQMYGIKTAARYCILPLNALIETGNADKAKYYIDILETESGYFDKEGIVEKGREVCYYYIGMYYLLLQQTDSAEYYFRKELYSTLDVDNQQMASRGLSLLFSQTHKPDSAAKYAIYSYNMLDSVFAQKATDEVERMAALHDYSRHQAIASQERQRAEEVSRDRNRLVIVIIGILLLLCWAFMTWRKRRKAILLQYERKVEELQRVKAELKDLHALETEKTNFQALSEELFRQIAVKEAVVGDLQIEIAQLRKSDFPLASEAEKQLGESEVYRWLQKAVKCEKLSEEQWHEIINMVKNILPGFHSFISSLRYDTESNAYRACILLRLHIRMQDASGFIGISKSRMSQICSSILNEVFGIQGSGKELQRRLECIE